QETPYRGFESRPLRQLEGTEVMVWRSSTTALDRMCASLVYLLPLYDGIDYGRFLFAQFPLLSYLKYPLIPLAFVYSAFPLGLGSLLVFIILFVAVVRNEKIPHFIRFNTMQAILLSIVLTIITLIYGFILQPLAITPLIDIQRCSISI
ncbi:MAG: Tic20 family protein, partial [Aquificaceae bacterium]|nr:Tic20 family protein [Aquificaceae bacterium]